MKHNRITLSYKFLVSSGNRLSFFDKSRVPTIVREFSWRFLWFVMKGAVLQYAPVIYTACCISTSSSLSPLREPLLSPIYSTLPVFPLMKQCCAALAICPPHQPDASSHNVESIIRSKRRFVRLPLSPGSRSGHANNR